MLIFVHMWHPVQQPNAAAAMTSYSDKGVILGAQHPVLIDDLMIERCCVEEDPARAKMEKTQQPNGLISETFYQKMK